MKTLLLTAVLITGLCAGLLLPVSAGSTPDEATLREITSLEALKEYLDNQTRWYETLYLNEADGTGVRDIMTGTRLEEAVAPAPSADKGATEAATHSSTNIQVAGVDEADYLKNDGTYLYLLREDQLLIAAVFPPEDGRIISRTRIDGNPAALFLDGDRLVVFSSGYGDGGAIRETNEMMPAPADHTRALVYDIASRATPRLIRELVLPGTYENGRMINGTVYAVTSAGMYLNEPFMPIIYDGSEAIARPSVWCPHIPLTSYSLSTLSSFPISGEGEVHAASFLMGYENTLYVSIDNAYIAYRLWNPYWWSGGILPKVTAIPETGEESVIHRFALDGGDITYQASGTVPGRLLNQFSLDQYHENLRVATTTNGYTSGDYQEENNVFVLSPDLSIRGRLQHLAPGEKIYSARFMGDLLYLVTFRQVDPLFVIDLSNPDQPGILGELKIPGYSDYLHPYDARHLIGIGKDTEESEWGGVIPTGIKIALFDVTDVNNPRLVDSRVIGEKGSDSEVLRDHKAFLLDHHQNLMVLPITEIIRIPVMESSFPGSYTTAAWKGAYVFGVDPEGGFIEKGRVEQDAVRPDPYAESGMTVRRSVLMDAVLYTVSDNRIIGTDAGNPERRLMLLDLPESS